MSQSGAVGCAAFSHLVDNRFKLQAVGRDTDSCQQVGLFLLIALMVFVFYNDIYRLFDPGRGMPYAFPCVTILPIQSWIECPRGVNQTFEFYLRFHCLPNV